MTFFESIRVTPVDTAETGATDRTSAIVDVRGYEGCAFVVHASEAPAAAGASVKIQGGNLPDGSDMADLSGVTDAMEQAPAAAVGVAYVLDVGQPRFRYLRAVVTHTGSGDTSSSVIAYLYGAKREPVGQDAGVASVKRFRAAEAA